MPMTGDITRWLHEFSHGDNRAAQGIFLHYFGQLTRVARRHLDTMPRRAVDEEDIALSAMESFFRGIPAGKYAQLENRGDIRSLSRQFVATAPIQGARPRWKWAGRAASSRH